MTNITRRDVVKISSSAALVGATLSAGAVSATQGRAAEESTTGIRRFRVLDANSGKPAITVAPIISLVSVHGNIVYLSGVTADVARLGDIKDQTKQVLERIDLGLNAAGTSKSNLLSAQVWLTDMSLFEEHNAAWNAWVDPKNPPVRMCVQSPQLWHRGLLVEIMVTAARNT